MNAIELKNVKKSYGDFSLELSLALPKGCILGLIGENGAGKSTAIRLMLGMAHADAGSIKLFGQDIAHAPDSIREDIGVVLDEPGFPTCLTALQIEKVMSGIYKNWDKELYLSYLKKLSLPENKAFQDFSRGMKMKLSIAVALSHGAKLLILDEPTSGLDPVVRDEVVELFLDFTRSEEHSILISSHIVSDLEKLCDYVAFLHKGRLMLFEEKDTLLSEYGILRCSAQDFAAISPEVVIGKKESPYGVTAIVPREAAKGMDLFPISIEELFIYMVKEVQ